MKKETKKEVKEKIKEETKEEAKKELKKEVKKEDKKEVNKNKKKIKKEEIIVEKNLNDIENEINKNYNENSYIKTLIENNLNENLLKKNEEIKNNHLESKLSTIIDNLKKNTVVEYETSNVKNIFDKINTNGLLVQIINNKLYYLEKKCENNKNIHCLNMLHKLLENNLINDSIFVIDTNKKSEYNENYVLRFNREENNNNLILPSYNLDYNFDEILKINWDDKKNKIYVNKNFISNKLYTNLIKENNKEVYEFEDNINYENLNEYKYILYEETINTIENEVDLLRFNSLMIKVKLENVNELETFYSEYLNTNHYISVSCESYDKIENIENTFKNLSIKESREKINSLNEQVSKILSDEIVTEYLKNLLSRLSIKCVPEQIISKKVFNTNTNNNYLYNRIDINENKFNFNFQGKDFDIMLKNGDNKINILINEFVTNIFYNNKNIFNYRIVGLVNNNQSSNYLFIVRNKMLYLYKNKNKLIFGCKLPEIFNIDNLAFRTFNKDSWWIC